jgi:hypothetical protein
VVAFPFAMLMEGLCAIELPLQERHRLIALASGLFMTLGWLLALRYSVHFFWRSPAIPWILCAATVVVSLLFESRLWSATTFGRSQSAAITPGENSPDASGDGDGKDSSSQE